MSCLLSLSFFFRALLTRENERSFSVEGLFFVQFVSEKSGRDRGSKCFFWILASSVVVVHSRVFASEERGKKKDAREWARSVRTYWYKYNETHSRNKASGVRARVCVGLERMSRRRQGGG